MVTTNGFVLFLSLSSLQVKDVVGLSRAPHELFTIARHQTKVEVTAFRVLVFDRSANEVLVVFGQQQSFFDVGQLIVLKAVLLYVQGLPL